MATLHNNRTLSSPTNSTDETFYNELSFRVGFIPKHNILVTGRDINALIGKERNNKFCLNNSSNRNGEYQAGFCLENRLTSQNTELEKRGNNGHTPTQITLV